MNDSQLDEIVKRWQAAAERAAVEGVRIVNVDGQLLATSSSRPLGAYRLEHTQDGWACECTANAEYGLPCKHLSAVADELHLDMLSDMRINWENVATVS